MMASQAHQFIAKMISQKMLKLKFEIISFDGNSAYISDLKINTPPSLKRHKPDLIGFRRIDKKICIGEAKTNTDLSSRRTSEQFKDYSSLVTKTKKQCILIIGIPISGVEKLERILNRLDLFTNKNIIILKVPDRLISNVKKKI
jgi:hypothetical protein